MDELIKQETMSSLQIAEITQKPHNDVLKAIRKMEDAWVKINGGDFSLVEYTDKKGEKRPCYQLTKTECLYIATKFNDEARAKLVLRWEELERKNMRHTPQTYLEALKALVVSEEEKQRLAMENSEQQRQIEQKNTEIVQLSHAITEMQPKVTYYDVILRSKGTCTVTQIAQDYGMSAKSFNAALQKLHIQRKVGTQWILYSKYLSEGYVHSKPIDIVRADGTHETKYNTEWTPKGRIFLYGELKEHGILPLVERE